MARRVQYDNKNKEGIIKEDACRRVNRMSVECKRCVDVTWNRGYANMLRVTNRKH